MNSLESDFINRNECLNSIRGLFNWSPINASIVSKLISISKKYLKSIDFIAVY